MNEYCPGVQRVCIAPEKCCLSGTVCCVPTSLYSLSSNDHPDKRIIIERDIRFSVINLWYFWFAVVFFVTTCSGVCAFWRRQRRMLLQAAERSASMRLQLNHCSHRVQLSPTMSHRQLGERQLGHRAPGCWQLGRRQRSHREAASVDPHVSYFATMVPIAYVDDEQGMIGSQFPAPPLYSEVVTDKASEFTYNNDEVPPSYAEASRYIHCSDAAAAMSTHVDEAGHSNHTKDEENNDDRSLLSPVSYHQMSAVDNDDDDDDDDDEQSVSVSATTQS